MHPVVSWGDLGYHGVSCRNQTDPFNLVHVIVFTKVCYIFQVTSIRNLRVLTNK